MSEAPDLRFHADRLIQIVEQYYRLDQVDREDWSTVLLGQAIIELGKMCGPAMITQAYGDCTNAYRASSMRALSERLWLCSLLFADAEKPGSGGAIVDAAQEAFYVANGDMPKMFAKISGMQGKRGATYEVAHWEMLALEWEANLEASGAEKVHLRSLITLAYGVTWDAIAKWKPKLKNTLGEKLYRYRLDVARRLGRDGMVGGMTLLTLEQTGAAYRGALGY